MQSNFCWCKVADKAIPRWLTFSKITHQVKLGPIAIKLVQSQLLLSPAEIVGPSLLITAIAQTQQSLRQLRVDFYDYVTMLPW